MDRIFPKIQSSEGIKRGVLVASEFLRDSHNNQFAHALNDCDRVEVEVGEKVRLGFAVEATGAWELIRRPEGSSAELRDAAIRPDKPGVFVARLALSGRYFRVVELCTFDYAQMYGTRERKVEEVRLQARSWLNEPGRQTSDVIARLEPISELAAAAEREREAQAKAAQEKAVDALTEKILREEEEKSRAAARARARSKAEKELAANG